MTPNLLDELEGVVAKIDAFRNLPFDAERRKLYTDASSAATEFLRTHAPALADMAKRMEAAERDAARYRWLRDKAWSMPAIAQQELPAVAIFSGSGRRCKDVSGEGMDAAIDAAIDATQEGDG